MRSAQKSNRARGRGSRKGNGGASLNRVYESNGPEGKVRGTPQQIIDKYLTLARDAQTAGDRVNAENFLQHAEHYQRVLAAALGAQQERRDQQAGQDEDDERGRPEQQQRGDGVVQAEQPQREEEQPRRRQKVDGAEKPASSGSAVVSGMQTIDSEDQEAGPELIVTPEDLSGEPSKRNGGGRRKVARETAEPPAE